MKTVIKISILALFFIVSAFTVKVDTNADKPIKSNIEVFAMHELELKEGVNAKEFEAFVSTEIVPIYKKMKGQNFNLVKGDRGERNGKYSVILTFERVEDRNRIYPPSGGLVGDFGEDAIWEKFYTMAKGLDGTSHTDYVKVN